VDIKNLATTNFSIKLLNKLAVHKYIFMEDFFSEPAYRGTKRFSQEQIPVAKATGFGAAADDYAERGIDLNEQLILNKPATFFLKMNSDAMLQTGLNKGDILIVDRSITATDGRIVVVALNGELLVRRLQLHNGKVTLVAGSNHESIEIKDMADCRTWGVVTCIIHIMEPRLMVTNQSQE
jgi:DNA polymerase V